MENTDSRFVECFFCKLIISHAEDNARLAVLGGEECIGIFDINVLVRKDINEMAKSARLVGDDCGSDLIYGCEIAVSLESLDSTVDITDDKTEDSEILCICNCHSAHIYARIGKHAGYCTESAGMVFKKYG